MKICVYPGNFDPFTLGHLDVLRNASSLFDIVYVSVHNDTAKRAMFTLSERVEMIERVIRETGLTNVKTDSFDGLLVEYAKRVGASHIIRGLRAITDFEKGFQIDSSNHRLAPTICTVYFMARPEHFLLSREACVKTLYEQASLKD